MTIDGRSPPVDRTRHAEAGGFAKPNVELAAGTLERGGP
jgi:hypothetical protein